MATRVIVRGRHQNPGGAPLGSDIPYILTVFLLELFLLPTGFLRSFDGLSVAGVIWGSEIGLELFASTCQMILVVTPTTHPSGRSSIRDLIPRLSRWSEKIPGSRSLGKLPI